HPAFRQRVLDPLVLADRPVEDFALAGVVDSLAQRRATQTHRLRGDEYPLRIHAVEDVFEPPALLADAIPSRDTKTIEKHLIGVDRLAAHFLDLADLDMRAVDGGVEQ